MKKVSRLGLPLKIKLLKVLICKELAIWEFLMQQM